jgi:hypothetical protein
MTKTITTIIMMMRTEVEAWVHHLEYLEIIKSVSLMLMFLY